MQFKNCVITGGTSGLGLSLVKKFISEGFYLHIIAKDKKKIDQLTEYLKKKNLSSFKFYQADLSEKKDINKVLFEIMKLESIDVLINNAGITYSKKELNSNGYEKTFVVNYLSHFFLTNSLLNLIIKSKKAKIINISSFLHKFAKLNLDDLNYSKKYNGMIAYCNSKLMNLLFNYKINRLYNNKIKCYAINPGWLNTNFGNNNRSILRFLLNFFRKLLAKNPQKTANEIFDICTDDYYLELSGKYFFNYKEIKSSDLSYNRNLQDKLWIKSLEMISSL